MSAGDRNKSGKAIDIVRHYSRNGDGKESICGLVLPWYSSSDFEDVTCKKCLRKLLKENLSKAT